MSSRFVGCSTLCRYVPIGIGLLLTILSSAVHSAKDSEGSTSGVFVTDSRSMWKSRFDARSQAELVAMISATLPLVRHHRLSRSQQGDAYVFASGIGGQKPRYGIYVAYGSIRALFGCYSSRSVASPIGQEKIFGLSNHSPQCLLMSIFAQTSSCSVRHPCKIEVCFRSR